MAEEQSNRKRIKLEDSIDYFMEEEQGEGAVVRSESNGGGGKREYNQENMSFEEDQGDVQGSVGSIEVGGAEGSVGKDGGTHADQDKMQLLSIFPAEIWSSILDKVDDPETLENLSNASGFFRDILENRRNTFLFSKVWKVLHQHCDKAVKSSRTCSEDERSYTKMTLKMRLVCESCREVIDDFFTSIPVNQIDFEHDWFVARLDFNDDFVVHFDDTHNCPNENQNPFPGRAVLLELYSNEEEDVEYDEDVENEDAQLGVLQEYGYHILKCCTHSFTGIYDTPDPNYYSRLKRWLPHMSNLRALKMVFPEESFPRLSAQPKLLNAITLNPSFPRMDSLLYLYLHHVPAQLAIQLLTASSDLKSIHLTCVEGCDEEINYPVSGIELPKLKRVNLTCKYTTDAHHEIDFLNKLKIRSPVTSFKFALEVLDPHESYREDSEEFKDLRRIFSLMENNWKLTLTAVKLEFPALIGLKERVAFYRLTKSMKPDLPNVKKIDLLIHSIVSLDFLLSMKDSLKVVILDLTFQINNKATEKFAIAAAERQKIQFLGYTDRLLDSNIWTRLPHLQRVIISESVYNPRNRESTPEWLRDHFKKLDKFTYTRKDWSLKQRRKRMVNFHLKVITIRDNLPFP